VSTLCPVEAIDEAGYHLLTHEVGAVLGDVLSGGAGGVLGQRNDRVTGRLPTACGGGGEHRRLPVVLAFPSVRARLALGTTGEHLLHRQRGCTGGRSRACGLQRGTVTATLLGALRVRALVFDNCHGRLLSTS